MTRLLRSFWLFWKRRPMHEPPGWTAGDARYLAAFLSSSTGCKLSIVLTNEIASANERAAMSKGSAFECGWACGYRAILAIFENFSAQREDSLASEDGDLLGAQEDPEFMRP